MDEWHVPKVATCSAGTKRIIVGFLARLCRPSWDRERERRLITRTMDDTADLAMLTSPNRVSHRRVRSDPSEFLRSLARADTFGEDDVDVEATGEVQAVEADETGPARSRSSSSASSDAEDERADADGPRCAPRRHTPSHEVKVLALAAARAPAVGAPSPPYARRLCAALPPPHRRPAPLCIASSPLRRPMSTHFRNMSSLFDNLPFPGPSASMFTPEELAQPKQPNYSKKDVPMWTVEEDLLILQLVDQHGKKWSKIAAHLPGRTDNGVRNRWNRMERAHVIKQRRPAGTGYRCRRCGEPKRGHICAARVLGLFDEPEGDDLHLKAVALTDLSAKAMQSIPAALSGQQQKRRSTPQLSAANALAVPPPPPMAVAMAVALTPMLTEDEPAEEEPSMMSTDHDELMLSSVLLCSVSLAPSLALSNAPPLLPDAPAAPAAPAAAPMPSAAAPMPTIAAPIPTAAAPIPAAAAAAAAASAASAASSSDEMRLSTNEVDEFLDELLAFHEDAASISCPS